MRVLCKNTRSLTDLRIWELVDELQNIQWDILCMSETRGSDQDVSVLGGHRLITTTMEDKYESRVESRVARSNKVRP